MKSSRRFLLVVAAAIVTTIVAAPVFAQKDAGSKARGEHSVPFWSSKASQRHFERARDYAHDFRGYVQANPQPAPAVVKEVTTGIGHSLGEAKKHLAQMKKDYAANKDAVVAVEGLEKQLAAAVVHHDALMACCNNATFEAMKTMDCCNDLADELDKILDSHAKLMDSLAHKHPAPAKKK
jgi:hypothetical protein